MAALASSCLENQLFEQSVDVLQELIPLHQRTAAATAASATARCPQYYLNLAQAYAGLKKTAEAVEAACGAIVSWGPRHDRRAEALQRCRKCCASARPGRLRRRSWTSRSPRPACNNPLVRKALGQVYLERRSTPRRWPN